MRIPMNRVQIECISALLIFFVPFLAGYLLYVLGYLTEVLGHYVIYPIYIVGSILLTIHNKRSLEEIGLTRKELFISFGYSMIFVIVNFFSRLFFTDLRLSPDSSSAFFFAYNLFYHLFGGFGQEIIFRGLILFSFNRWKGWKYALLISSILFGFAHILRGVMGIIATTIIGIYWGWVALKTRNIIGVSIAHGLYNFLFSFMFIS